MFRKRAPKLNIDLHQFLPVFAHNWKKNKTDCFKVLVFESNKLYNLYTEKRQLNYFKPKAQETLKAYNDI